MSGKINKVAFAGLIAERLGLTKPKAMETLNSIFEELIHQLKQGNSITLAGFGTLSVKARAAYTGRNPSTGAAIPIAASKVPHFKVGKELKDAVNG